MKSEPALLNRDQSLTAWATNSGPLSKRMIWSYEYCLSRRIAHMTAK